MLTIFYIVNKRWLATTKLYRTITILSDFEHKKEKHMLVSNILASKGTNVVSVEPSETVTEFLNILDQYQIGAVLVVRQNKVVGVISERDIARGLNTYGDMILTKPVSFLMTDLKVWCHSKTTVEELMVEMTQNRVRHIPVIDGGELVGIVSIGDVVKARIDTLEEERKALVSYITS